MMPSFFQSLQSNTALLQMFLFSLSVLFHHTVASVEETRIFQSNNNNNLRTTFSSFSSAITTLHHLDGRNLIVGGQKADPERYPYFVALQTADNHTECGGTLIAPDVVLTAAHCAASNLKHALVGKYWNDNNNHNDNYEFIEIVNPLESADEATLSFLQTSGGAIVDPSGFIHPQHNLKKRTYDVMLMKLQRPSTKPTVKVNFDSKLPVKRNNGNEIVVLGVGRIRVEGPKPDVLQQVYLNYLRYEDCIDHGEFNVDYKYELLPDMICTHGVGVYTTRGQCYGDSGGPYLSVGNSFQEDMQVGVVSWAVNCASDVFPMVGFRTSAGGAFIKDVTCAITANPEAVTMCTLIESRVQTGIVQVTNGVTVSVNIYSDPFSHEIAWKILSPDLTRVYAQIEYGDIQGDHDFYEVDLPPGKEFVFWIRDAADDGIFGDPDAILYEIVLVQQGQGRDIVLIGGDGGFFTERQVTFRVPTANEIPGLMLPLPDSVAKPLAGDSNAMTVFVHFVFGDYHEDLGWSITDATDKNKVLISKDFDTYRYGDQVTEEVNLSVGSYNFVVRDRRGTDEYRAFDSYRLSYRNADGDLISLVESQGAFIGEIKTESFTVPGNTKNSNSQGSPGGGTIGVCANFGMPCLVFSDCCSGRCANGVCRTPSVNPRRQRNRIGGSTRGGAASRPSRGT